jgi:hypothetical protein
MTESNVNKVKLIATIEPFGIKTFIVLPASSQVCNITYNLAKIHTFIDEVMKKHEINFKTGRVEYQGIWAMPQYVYLL